MISLSLFQFEGAEIDMDSRVGIFITMNPGYAGRTELPESVKALFRPVVVIVPDLQQICEIMLFSEGFLLAKVQFTNDVFYCAGEENVIYQMWSFMFTVKISCCMFDWSEFKQLKGSKPQYLCTRLLLTFHHENVY